MKPNSQNVKVSFLVISESLEDSIFGYYLLYIYVTAITDWCCITISLLLC